jgi:hypothetical protein
MTEENKVVTPPAAETPAPASTEAPKDPLAERVSTMQDALDTILENMSNKKPEPEVKEPASAVPPVTPPVSVPAPNKTSSVGENQQWLDAMRSIVSEEVGKVKEEVSKVKEEYNKKFEEMSVKDAMIELTAELKSAITKYPDADEHEVLAFIQQGSDKTVTDLAKESHEKFNSKLSIREKQIEETLRAKLLAEKEGGHSVPQNSGTSSPLTPEGNNYSPNGAVNRRMSDDAAWAQARREAKAGLK